jgi:hypothetical protein
MEYRIEKDTIGEVKVPADKYWGAQTERSRNNFKIGPSASMPLEIVHAFAYLKKAAAHANCELGVLEAEKRDLISGAADEIIAGKLDDQFPLVIWQTGSGTQSNMNVNEVIANRAHVMAGNKLGEGTKTIAPNDDVNKSQSSNDTFPTGMHIACYKKIIETTIPGIELTWNILEKSMLIGDRKVSLGKKYPQIRVKAVRGWKGIAESDIEYLRLNAEISHTTRIGTIGKFHWKIAASKVVGDVPLALTHNGNGTRQFWNVSVPNSFETMPSGSFYTTEQANLFTRFTFRAIKTKATWNEPRFGVHHAIGFGNFTNREDHQWTFETMDKGFYEAGFIFDGILTNNFTSIGLGAFYRYGHYSNADWKQNIVPKLVLSFNVE